MTTNTATMATPAATSGLSAAMTFVMAAACGLVAANSIIPSRSQARSLPRSACRHMPPASSSR